MDLEGDVTFHELAQEFSRRNRLIKKPLKIHSAEAPVEADRRGRSWALAVRPTRLSER